MPTIGELVIDIKASTASIQTEMGKLEGTMAKSSANIVSNLKNVVDLLVLQFGVRAVRSIADFVDRTIEAGDKLGRLSQATGMSVAGFSGMAYAAKMADVDIDQFATGVERMAFKLMQAQKGNKDLSAEFKSFGIDPEKIRSPEEALTRLAQKFESLPPSVDKTALAIEIFGRGGAAMLPVLNLGAKGISEFADEARKLGIRLDEDAVAKFEAAHESLKRLRAMFEGFAFNVVSQVAPALANYVNQLVDANAKSGDLKILSDQAVAALKVLATTLIGLYGILRLVADALVLAGLGIKTWMFPASFEENFAQFKEMARITLEDVKNSYATMKGLWTDFDSTTKPSGKPKITIITDDPNDPKNLFKRKNAVTEIIAKLREEAETIGLTKEQALALQAAQQGANARQQRELTDIVETIRERKDAEKEEAEWAKTAAIGVPEYGPWTNEQMIRMREAEGYTTKMIEASDKLDESYAKAQEKMIGFFKDSLTWEDKWRIEVEEIVELWRLYPELADQAAIAIAGMNKKWDEHYAKADKFKNMLLDIRRDLSQTFAQAILEADSFGDAMSRLLMKIAETILEVKILDPLLDKIFKKKSEGEEESDGGGGGGGILGWFGSFFGGLFKKQGGGSFSAGQPLLVGEAGPEVIYPGLSGTVIPNHALGGVTYNIDARGADPTVEFRLRRALRDVERRSVARSVATNREMQFRNVT